MNRKNSRRQFIKASSAFAGIQFLPSGILANSPNSKLCTAHIGIAGKGKTDTLSIDADPRTQVVGLCDVDAMHLYGKGKRAEQKAGDTSVAKFGENVKRFRDYREMFREMGDKIDAVSVSTPDHTHYPATLAAMELGKHVYTQKPLTNNIAEARHLMEVAREKKVATQMGTQNKSSLSYRTATHFIRDGVIGKVSKVYVWSYKDWGHDGAPYTGEDKVPDFLDWNLWLGTAPEHSFLEGKYHPSNWRRIIDFGCGTLGDMGIHIFDTPFGSLGLKAPKWVKTECRQPNQFSLPLKSKVSYGFDPTEFTTNDFEWHWFDGAYAPPKDEPDLEVPEGQTLPTQGAMFIGEKGKMLLRHVGGPQFFPRSIYETLVKPDLPKKVSHYGQWIDTIYGSSEKPSANFDYAAPLTETVLLGCVAGRFPGETLEWDTEKAEFPNFPDANQFVKRELRKF